MPPDRINVDGTNLILNAVEAVARGGTEVQLEDQARAKVKSAAQRLAELADSDQSIYGVNTGFGAFADRRIKAEQIRNLSSNLIQSHAAAVGPAFAPDVVRAAMLIRANTLATGHSGVRPTVIDTLLQMLNHDVTPYVPSQGSLGSSGDLASLAHMALVFSEPPDSQGSSGRAWYQNDLLRGTEAMQRAGIERIVLGPKEGLAITNGASFSAALLALGIQDAARLLSQADIVATMTLEALLGRSAAFDDRLHRSRHHPGQKAVAARVRMLSQGSTLLDSGDQVQDAYSLRCIPQIHGPGLELLDFVRSIAEREINAATDNPLLYDGDVISGGNFHGQPLGFACDYLKLPLVELGAISERRTFRLTAPHTNRGLPPMLVAAEERAGLESGLMMLQYTAASLVLENQTLAAPDSVLSLPTSAGQEDLNANSTTAGRRLLALVQNCQNILAIEWLAAAQALDLRRRNRPDSELGAGTRVALELLRERVPFFDHDQPLDEHIENAANLLRHGALQTAVEARLQPLPGPGHP